MPAVGVRGEPLLWDQGVSDFALRGAVILASAEAAVGASDLAERNDCDRVAN
jgi:hypothetical protein